MGDGAETERGPAEAILGADRAATAPGTERVEMGEGFATVRMRITAETGARR
ncbi:hypothetical protein [Streptomyces sp. 3N207]|uniref:hypothetical protein n=1 Tax=Streptomyces sp. 3N207 TaxID=3457417 RepID=UPI003FD401C7